MPVLGALSYKTTEKVICDNDDCIKEAKGNKRMKWHGRKVGPTSGTLEPRYT